MRHLYKLRFFTGLVLALPVALGVVWYAWSAFASIDRYRRTTKDAPPLDAALFQLALHDELVRDWRRMTLPARPADSALPTFELSLNRENLDLLADTRNKRDGAAGYAAAFVRTRRKTYPAELRYRGGQHWHWIGPQQSLKLRFERGELIDGTRVLNLLNDVTPFGLEDQIILDLAREGGLLTPEYFPVWVRLNNTDMGVYRYQAQPEEGLLRRGRRIPGSMFSGDSESKAGVFADEAGWTKVASKDEAHEDDRSELARLLWAVNDATQEEFTAYATKSIDLERYAAFDALDVVFGGNDHDWFSNHKLYLDPYRGTMEPVAWGFRGFQHEPRMNLVDNPLLLRLKMTPGYLALRNRAVYQLLVGKAAVPEIRARADRSFARLLPDLDADPYWDAYKLLPRVSRFHRFMVRPMSKRKWLLSAQLELGGFARRSRYLLDLLESPGIRSTVSARGAAGVVRIVVDGDAAYTLRTVSVAAPCSGSFEIHADDGANTLVARGPLDRPARAEARVDLVAGVRFVPRPEPQAKTGPVLTEVEPRTYRFVVSADCMPASADLDLDNRTTGGSRRVSGSFAGAPPDGAPVPDAKDAKKVPAFAAGEVSAHPWEYPPSARTRDVVLGPGRVAITATRVFTAEQTVTVAPGTELALGPGVSLVFRGKVIVEGARIVPIESGTFHGGLVLHGPGTAGSRLGRLMVSGGSHPSASLGEYTAVVNLHDTTDIEIDRLTIESPSAVEDALHAVYVTRLRLRDVVVRKAPVDAVDLEFVDAEIRGLRVGAAGDDCLDLMGSAVNLDDSILTGCRNNGISAGEETTVVAHGALISGATVAVLAKNASSVLLSRSLVHRSGTALQTNLKELYYSGASSIGAQELFVVEVSKIVSAAAKTSIDPGFVQTSFEDRDLEYLRDEVVHLRNWDDLPGFVAEFER